MKKITRFIGIVAIGSMLIVSCKKQSNEVEVPTIPSDISAMVKAAGFNEGRIEITDGGYLIEGDIFMTKDELSTMANNNGPELVIADEEHYRTTNLVNGTRTITVSLNTTQANFVAATTEAIRRYNALPLRIKFQRVSGTNANINIRTFFQNSNTLGFAGFPSGGNPFNTVNLNTRFYTPSVAVNPLATTIAHEIGHCIGFRHTDYMNRAFSCGGAATNEGSAGIGAIFIPGTPSGPSSGSWMLACGSTTLNRNFTSADNTALNFVY